MASIIAKYSKATLPNGRIPTEEEIVSWVQNTEQTGKVKDFLGLHPELVGVVKNLAAMKERLTKTVERKAYEKFASRNGQHGKDCEDWYEAEKEVSDKISPLATK